MVKPKTNARLQDNGEDSVKIQASSIHTRDFPPALDVSMSWLAWQYLNFVNLATSDCSCIQNLHILPYDTPVISLLKSTNLPRLPFKTPTLLFIPSEALPMVAYPR